MKRGWEDILESHQEFLLRYASMHGEPNIELYRVYCPTCDKIATELEAICSIARSWLTPHGQAKTNSLGAVPVATTT